MKVTTLSLNGEKKEEIELPIIFSTPFRKDLIHKAYTNLNSNRFQRQGRHPTAGMDVVARSLDPPTGHGQSRIAKMRGGGGGRQGEAGGVASVKGGRQAHPPIVDRVIRKKINKKENKLALCSAIAATASKRLIESRGHKVDKIESFPIADRMVQRTTRSASEPETRGFVADRRRVWRCDVPADSRLPGGPLW